MKAPIDFTSQTCLIIDEFQRLLSVFCTSQLNLYALTFEDLRSSTPQLVYLQMKITSFNVNSLKTLRQYYPWTTKKSFSEIFDALGAEILCFQEVKLSRLDQADIAIPRGYDGYFSLSTSRIKGYMKC